MSSVTSIKGYYTNGTYMGYIPSINDYIPFESETAYKEYLHEWEGI